MLVGVVTIEIHIPQAFSLKDKRGVVKSVIHRVRNRFNVSICELDRQDIWKEATLGVACISSDRKVIEMVFRSVEDFLEENGDLQITSFDTEVL